MFFKSVWHCIIGPHRMHQMRTIAIDDCWHLSVYLANTAERIEVPLARRLLGTQEYCIRRRPDAPTDSMRPSSSYFGHLSGAAACSSYLLSRLIDESTLVSIVCGLTVFAADGTVLGQRWRLRLCVCTTTTTCRHCTT